MRLCTQHGQKGYVAVTLTVIHKFGFVIQIKENNVVCFDL